MSGSDYAKVAMFSIMQQHGSARLVRPSNTPEFACKHGQVVTRPKANSDSPLKTFVSPARSSKRSLQPSGERAQDSPDWDRATADPGLIPHFQVATLLPETATACLRIARTLSIVRDANPVPGPWRCTDDDVTLVQRSQRL